MRALLPGRAGVCIRILLLSFHLLVLLAVRAGSTPSYEVPQPALASTAIRQGQGNPGCIDAHEL